MFRPIRRKNKQISDEEAKKLLSENRIGVLSVNGDGGYPYAVPVNYIYDEANGKIFFHGARAGHKYDSLKKCDKVCFTVYGKETIKDLEWAPYVKSTVVFGRCSMIDYENFGAEMLKKLAMKYYPDEATADEEIKKSGKAVQMFMIEIEHLSGKEIQEL